MNKKFTFRRAIILPVLAVALLLTSSACGTSPTPTPFIQTVVNTQLVTRVVTQDVTEVVTKIVEVPVTETPAPTLPVTPMPDPNATPAETGLPKASLPAYTDCLYGPADWFEYKSSFPADQLVDVLGKSEDGNWLNIEAAGGWNSCWIPATQAQLEDGPEEALPVVQPVWPVVYFDLASPSATASRKGNEVILSWKAVPMSRDEIRGYLIRAKLCQGGQLIPQDIFIPMTYAENTGSLSYTITDENGCTEPSDVHMISYTRRGFAGYYQTGKMGWEKVFLPPYTN